MTIAPYRLGLTATYERADGQHEVLEELIGPVVYEEEVDNLAGEYLSEYETIHLQVELTPDERERYDEEYQIYRDYIDNNDFEIWKENGYQEFLKRTSYDPHGRRALIAKQRAETIARTAEKKLDTSTIFSNVTMPTGRSSSPPTTISHTRFPRSSSSRVSPTRLRQTSAVKSSLASAAASIPCWSPPRSSTKESTFPLQTLELFSRGVPRNASMPNVLDGSSAPPDDRQPARLYEIITEDTMETYVSQRRRQGVSSDADS